MDLNKKSILASVYLIKNNHGNIRIMCDTFSKRTIMTPNNVRCQFGVFTVNFEQIYHIFLVFPLLILNK